MTDPITRQKLSDKDRTDLFKKGSERSGEEDNQFPLGNTSNRG